MSLSAGLRYVHVRWTHVSEDDPVLLWSEVDAQGLEQRKVEEYQDGSLDFANGRRETGSTSLGVGPVPSVTEINSLAEFEAVEIERQQFERQWDRAVRSHRPDEDAWRKAKDDYPVGAVISAEVADIYPFGIGVALPDCPVPGIITAPSFGSTAEYQQRALVFPLHSTIDVRVIGHAEGRLQIDLEPVNPPASQS